MLLSECPVIAISPFHRPDPRIVAAACRAGALGVLCLGRDPDAARRSLALLARHLALPFGVRVSRHSGVAPSELPPNVAVVVLPSGEGIEPWRGRQVIVEATSVEEATRAASGGAAAVIAKGSEAGGRIGDEPAFVLFQRVRRAVALPVFVQGGIGLHTAAACAAGGAAGVVLDGQLALAAESGLPREVREAIRHMDGDATTVISGYRVLTRPDLPVASLGAGLDPALVEARIGADDLHADLVPAGQDAAFAQPLSARFRSTGAIVQAVAASMADGVRVARSLRPLGPGSPFAEAYGIRYPIVQGPMSAVSESAAFAGAVSDAGGLPLVALGLIPGPAARRLLDDVRARLGEGRTWGVGILGFAQPELRAEQLAALEEARPPVVLIAGGRPSQARPIEALGSRVFLHVPSPGLLDLFLKDGARRFVFEGRECGGHIGPRTSFVLWEQQLGRLLDVPDPTSLEILFAGGVHDGASAAMVSAAAAQLAARGARIGVLMGTAYLFTREAVDTGAILPSFQRVAIECERTALLETAPGHATRCAITPYVQTFEVHRQRLTGEGRAPAEVWAALEQLNLGRLRMAAKGVRFDGTGFVPVDAAEKEQEGLFMIGQVAPLREEVVTMKELHEDVSAGGARHLETAPLRHSTPADPVDVAIIGMACIFPDAPDLESYWSNIVNGRISVSEVPAERWSTEIYYDAGGPGGEKSVAKVGGFLPDVPFDPVEYGIPPRSLAAIEPIQLLSLEVARRALKDAGYLDRELRRETTSVIFGAEAGTELASAYGFRALYPQYCGELPPELDAVLPRLTEDSFPGVLANVIAGRIANRLDLSGANFTVDAACASSLAAVDLGVKELVTGTSDMVLCGGADLHNSVNDYLLFSSVHALSRQGACRTFDAEADGTVLGEGVAVVVLKRLADAERDGDRIYAVIKGVGASSDGRSLGLTAPRKEGQIRALERAYRRAGVSPAGVGLVEAHGTGTVVGDRTEIGTLNDVFTAAGAEPGSSALGSVKTQIGHTKCAAGMAGLIKSALALYRKVLPPAVGVRRPNPAYDPRTSPFVLCDTARPWPFAGRRAAVSAFGFGGTNFHLVLSEHEDPLSPDDRRAGHAEWPAEVFVFRGADRQEAGETMARLHALLGLPGPWRLRDLAATTASLGRGDVQVALVAADIDDLRGKMDKAARFEPDAAGVFVRPEGALAGAQKPVAVLFPGQGSQRPGMMADVFVALPQLQRHLALGRAEWLRALFPGSAFTPEERAAKKAAITDTRVAQPVLGMVDLAVYELLCSLGLEPAMMGGHSYGELVALCAAGAMDEADLLTTSLARGEAILAAAGEDPGTMAAVSGSQAEVEAAMEHVAGVVVANQNAPRQTVISGTAVGVARATEALRAAGLEVQTFPVACAFHSPVVAGASDALRRHLEAVPVRAPAVPVYSNTTAQSYPAEPAAIRDRLAEHVARPVRFADQVRAMYDSGARIFVEAGPGRVLTGLVGRILDGRPHVAVSCDGGGDGSLRHVLLAVARLCTSGVPLDVRPLFAGRDVRPIDLERPPASEHRPTVWMVNGHTARPVRGELPEHAMVPTTRPVLTGGHRGAAPTEDDERQAVMLEYLSTMRQMMDAQKQVMLSYLGETATAEPTRAPAEPGPEEVGASRPPVSDAAVPAEPAQDVPIEDLLLGIVSERTGYPTEMLGLDLDLEADLSVDSIKRIEIIGALGEKLGFGADEAGRDQLVEQLAGLKTLRGMLKWLLENLGRAGGAGEAPAAPPAPVEPQAPPASVGRYVLRVVDAPPATAGASIEGKRFVITDDGFGVAGRLAELLAAAGAVPRVIPANGSFEEGDALVHLVPLANGGSVCDPVLSLFELTQQAISSGACSVLSATDHGGRFGRAGVPDACPGGRPPGPPVQPRGGIAGLLKSVAREHPDVAVRIVDLDPGEGPDVLAGQLEAEIRAGDGLLEVGYARGGRAVLDVVEQRLAGRRDGCRVQLGPESVVLLTGGARGITAEVAVGLARRYRCTLELVGRSPLPESAEDLELSAAAGATELRGILVARGGFGSPREIEAECSRVLAEREIRATLGRIHGAGAAASYHSLDVRDRDAFRELIEGIYARRGRLDGVIHGAGVLEDKLFRHKTRESFERVFRTKVAPAATLLETVRADIGFVVFFSSISGTFGNRGQTDYAAANDALDKLALAANARLPGRVVSIDWGPWGGTGMVTPELEREYARRGIALIPREIGVESLIDELCHGGADDAQVILTSNVPAALGA